MPGLLSSPVCLTVIWFLSWSLHPSCAQIQSDEVSDTQYGRLDSNVTLACGKSQIGIPVVWHHNHSSALPRHMVTSNGSLVLLHVNHSAQGSYSCYDDRGLLLHSVNLRLGRPPGLLSISCQVPNHTYVRCSWVDSVRTFLPAKYNASIRGIGMEWRPCIVDIARKHCALDHPAYWQTTHTLRVTETNVLGSETTYVQFRLNELLKPNPPESLLVKEQEGHPKRLIVSWSIPSSWPPYVAFPLLFHIRYRPQGSIYWSEIYTEERQAIILDALAGHIHQVQVRARDEVDSDSQWSEWSSLFLVKPWEGYTTPDPDDEEIFPDYIISVITKQENSTEKSHKPELEDEGNLGLVILLVLFSVVILTTVLSLIFVLWMRQKRRDNVTKQELTSMVKMKAMPI